MLVTRQAVLKAAAEDMAEALCAYVTRNRDFLSPLEPAREPDYYTVEAQREVLLNDIAAAREGRGYRFYIFPAEEPHRIIGSIALSNIVMGAFCSCFMGYRLDKDYTKRGIMSEAVRAVCAYAFDTLALHRIEGNVMPRNIASLRVLEKCGFEYEGRSRAYLRINGVWEEHIHMVLLNDADC